MGRHYVRLLPVLASLTLACGGSTDDGGGSSGSTSSGSSTGGATVFTSKVCVKEDATLFDGFTLTSLDYLELRRQMTDDPKARTVATIGVMCGTATASTRQRCITDVGEIESKKGWYSGGLGSFRTWDYVVTTKGDLITTLTDAKMVGPALAPLDSETKAAVAVALSEQGRTDCDGGNNVAKTATGYEVKVTHGGADGGNNCVDLTERIYTVTTDGVATLKTERLLEKAGPCT